LAPTGIDDAMLTGAETLADRPTAGNPELKPGIQIDLLLKLLFNDFRKDGISRENRSISIRFC
jgi:hypothetical protein